MTRLILETSTTKMAAENEPLLVSNDDAMENVRRRVQRNIAGKYLEAIAPEMLENHEDVPDHEKLSRNMSEEDREEFEKKYEKYRTKQSSYSIQNILWFIGSIALFYYTDFYIACRYDPRVNRPWFNIGAILIIVNIAIGFFFIIWLSYIKKIPSDEWETKYPVLIPIATGSFIMGGICVTVGLWPIWNIFTPVILFTLFMGFIVTIAMLPNF